MYEKLWRTIFFFPQRESILKPFFMLNIRKEKVFKAPRTLKKKCANYSRPTISTEKHYLSGQ